MMSRRCKTVSFDLSDKFEEELLEYAEAQGKFSRYVKRLIEDDRKRKLNMNYDNGSNEEEKDDYTLNAMSGFL